MAARTITVQLDDEVSRWLEYCAGERAGGDEALAIRQALADYVRRIRVDNLMAKRERIAAQPPFETDPDVPLSRGGGGPPRPHPRIC